MQMLRACNSTSTVYLAYYDGLWRTHVHQRSSFVEAPLMPAVMSRIIHSYLSYYPRKQHAFVLVLIVDSVQQTLRKRK